MDRQTALQLLEQGAVVYNWKGRAGFETWVQKFPDCSEARAYLNRVVDYFNLINLAESPYRFGFDPRDILEEIPPVILSQELEEAV